MLRLRRGTKRPCGRRLPKAAPASGSSARDFRQRPASRTLSLRKLPHRQHPNERWHPRRPGLQLPRVKFVWKFRVGRNVLRYV